MISRVGIGCVELDFELCDLGPALLHLFGEVLFLQLQLFGEGLLLGFD